MSLVAPVEDGKILESSTTGSASKSKGNNGMDKDTFLQLLVAQMQYQDPLEPTSNTEFISQYAQFSQVEQIQNMAGSTELQRASALVGKEVYIKSTDASGNTKYIQGKVDYVVYENGKPYLSVEENLYELSEVDTVWDDEYFKAYTLAMDFVTSLNKLPSVNAIDLSDGEAIDKLEEIYNDMTDYQKMFVAKEKVESLEKYIERLKLLRTQAGIGVDDEDGDEDGDGDGEVGDVDGNEDSDGE